MSYGLFGDMPSEQRQRRSNAYEGPLFDAIDRQLLEELGDWTLAKGPSTVWG